MVARSCLQVPLWRFGNFSRGSTGVQIKTDEKRTAHFRRNLYFQRSKPLSIRLKLKLGTKALLGAALVIVLNTALVAGAAYWSLSSDSNERAKRDIEDNLRTLALTFSEVFPDARVTVQDGIVRRIEIPQFPALKDHGVVDRAVGYVGGNATLFAYDDASGQFVRRSTNVKKENGERAVGTQLAADHPAQALLRRGEAYKGPATLFGKSFMTAYFPVADASG